MFEISVAMVTATKMVIIMVYIDFCCFQCYLCSDVHERQEDAKRSALELARVIVSKSPVAVQGSKRNLVFSRDHPVDVSLDYAVSLK